MLTQLRPAITLTIIFTLLTGLAYPLAITGIGQALFPSQANGSPVTRDGAVVGSSLIGQDFSSPVYFWSRPSATGPDPYNAGASSGSNLGPTSRALVERVTESVAGFGGGPVPGDAATTSGSGLDPHVSPAYALAQVERVATSRDAPVEEVRGLVERFTETPDLGLFGEARVNVLLLNLALDEAFPSANG
jgi:potassium-transporting ATPase KdpC subunit